MTKLLHESGMPSRQLGQCTSDQVEESRMNANRHELLAFICIH